MSLFSELGLVSGDKAAIIGCGGKTSLIYKLAAEKSGGSVLITTTTRIFRPPAHVYDFEVNGDYGEVKNGVHLLYGGAENGKLTPPPFVELTRAQRAFDCVLIEADGSRARPLKGWAECEPVIPDFVTATVAVAACSPIGEALSEKNTHRLSIFRELTGAGVGEPVTAAHIASMISHPRGMMQKARGKRILFINQADDETGQKRGLEVLNCLPETFLRSLFRVVIGSLRQNTFERVGCGL